MKKTTILSTILIAALGLGITGCDLNQKTETDKKTEQVNENKDTVGATSATPSKQDDPTLKESTKDVEFKKDIMDEMKDKTKETYDSAKKGLTEMSNSISEKSSELYEKTKKSIEKEASEETVKEEKELDKKLDM